MSEWLQKNAWSLLIAAVGVVATFSIYGYRIDNLEKENAAQDVQMATMASQQVQTQVTLAQISVDLTYIKAAIDRLLK